jgi:hypothetical protein
MLSDNVLSGDIVHVLRNNVAFPYKNKNRNMQDSDTKFNNWDLNITPANSDFESVSDEGWKGPRKPDGSLPDIPFLKLKKTSEYVDKGTDVGLPFAGDAPDLGAYETGMTSSLQNEKPSPQIRQSAAGMKNTQAEDCRYFDLTGRKLSPHHMQQGLQLLLYRRASGTSHLLLFISPTQSIGRSEK